MLHRTNTLVAGALVLAGLAAWNPARSATPAPVGPGAVIAMHKVLFGHIDRGEVEEALAFLHEDMNMETEYRKRPMTLYFSDLDGIDEKTVGYDGSRRLLGAWVREAGDAPGEWKTTIVDARDDCFSAELTYAVLEFERVREVEGEVVSRRRYVSTALATYDGGWKLTHWHVSPAPGTAAKKGVSKKKR